MRTWKALKNADGKGGIRYREHPTRKHGRQPDRYYTAVYWWQGKTVSEGIGWASENWTPTKCFDLLAQIKKNQGTGKGPCTLAELRAQSNAERDAKQQESARKDVMVSVVWAEYIEARRPKWSDRHYADHIDLAKPGGEVAKRRKKGTKILAGPLSSLMALKLSELTPETVSAWAEKEAAKRGARTRLSFSLFRAFVNWCDQQPEYTGIVSPTAVHTRIKREVIPRQRPKDDCLQREQLPAWFKAVRGLSNPTQAAYLQTLLLTGTRRNELAGLQWEDIDFKWKALTIHDKVEGERTIPLTPYVESLLAPLPRRNEWVFSSPIYKKVKRTMSKSGRIEEPRIPHNRALALAGIESLTLHGLRRSFGTLSEWVEVPAGVVAQLQGHKPSATAEKHYRRRPLDLLRVWHVKIEKWILDQAGIEQPPEVKTGLHVVNKS